VRGGGRKSFLSSSSLLPLKQNRGRTKNIPTPLPLSYIYILLSLPFLYLLSHSTVYSDLSLAINIKREEKRKYGEEDPL
jgi:hypothetical protein